MTKFASLFRSYGSAANLSEVASRLPAIMIALWLGVLSISMVPRLNLLEGGVLFILFFISCLLIDSLLNPRRLKNPKVGNAIQVIGSRNYAVLIGIHIVITLILAAHISIILLKGQILLIIIIGFLLNGINSSYLSRKESLVSVNNVTSIASGVVLPMVAAFYIVGNSFDFFSITIIAGIAFIYLGIETFNQTRTDIEISASPNKANSIEWEAICVASELEVPKNRIKEIGVQLYNIHNENEFNQVPLEQRVLFLPHCLRVADRCKGTYDEEGLHCKYCTKECKINIITRTAEKMGYKCFVVPGGAMVFNIAKKYNPKGVVAVACFNELREGTSRTEAEYKVPFQVIPLLKDGCVNTEVSEKEVIDVLSTIDEKVLKNT
jgi:hypothetical protein